MSFLQVLDKDFVSSVNKVLSTRCSERCWLLSKLQTNRP